MIETRQITGGILAGGEGRRLGGIDKGWYDVSGHSLVEHTIRRLHGQCGQIVISANRNRDLYRALGWPVVADDSDDARGPLAGIAAVLKSASTPYVLLSPVDTPLLPLDLGGRLTRAMSSDIDLAVASSPGGRHPLHALLRRHLLDDIQAALFAGVRRVADWQNATRLRVVEWEDDLAFANVNTADEADRVAAQLADDI